ncbi:MAG: hypothetical protein HC922_01490 [Leptolyngbyaceae cyanobacterium SM2_3_12]|nr:hypothetical protein [Leptolyngbyaceae cyanobacterium SM2_3_12]
MAITVRGPSSPPKTTAIASNASNKEEPPTPIRQFWHRPLVWGSGLTLLGIAAMLWQSGLTVAFQANSSRGVTPFMATPVPTLATDLGLLLPPQEKVVYLTEQGGSTAGQGSLPRRPGHLR